MRVLAFSDLHGNGFQEAERLTKAHQPDWIVLCGDMLPDFNQRPEGRRLEAQRAFWQEHRHAFLREGAITTFVLGNHELTGFRDAEMSTIPESLAGQVVRLEGIPGDSGPFSFAKGSPDPVLQAELDNQLNITPEPLIYISHAPPYGSLDLTHRGTHIGHKPLFHHLKEHNWPQALVLSGHVHQSYGEEQAGGTTVLNLATGYALLEWAEGQVQVLERSRLVAGGSFWDSP